MKTPREVLLARHESAMPKLEEIRRAVVTGLTPHPAREGLLPGLIVLKLWNELIWPARRIWAGLAAAWIVILAVNVQIARSDPVAGRRIAPPSLAVLMALREQERQLTELTEPRERREMDRPKPMVPRPRSQARFEFLIA